MPVGNQSSERPSLESCSIFLECISSAGFTALQIKHHESPGQSGWKTAYRNWKRTTFSSHVVLQDIGYMQESQASKRPDFVINGAMYAKATMLNFARSWIAGTKVSQPSCDCRWQHILP